MHLTGNGAWLGFIALKSVVRKSTKQGPFPAKWDGILYFIFVCDTHTEKSFRNLFNLNQIWIVIYTFK